MRSVEYEYRHSEGVTLACFEMLGTSSLGGCRRFGTRGMLSDKVIYTRVMFDG